jgi:hypothetical protein
VCPSPTMGTRDECATTAASHTSSVEQEVLEGPRSSWSNLYMAQVSETQGGKRGVRVEISPPLAAELRIQCMVLLHS